MYLTPERLIRLEIGEIPEAAFLAAYPEGVVLDLKICTWLPGMTDTAWNLLADDMFSPTVLDKYTEDCDAEWYVYLEEVQLFWGVYACSNPRGTWSEYMQAVARARARLLHKVFHIFSHYAAQS